MGLQSLCQIDDGQGRIASGDDVIDRQSVRLVERREKAQALQAIRTVEVAPAPSRVHDDQLPLRDALCVMQSAERGKGKICSSEHVVPVAIFALLTRFFGATVRMGQGDCASN